MPHNNLATNALLVVILVLFAIVGGDEAIRAVRPLLAMRLRRLASDFSWIETAQSSAHKPDQLYVLVSGNRKIVCGLVPALGLRPPPRPASVKYTWLS